MEEFENGTKRNNKNEADYLCADGLRTDLSDGNSDVVWQYKRTLYFKITDMRAGEKRIQRKRVKEIPNI